ncbi:MAG TPA: hypothetical protein VFG41_01135 [Sphingomicrobium sp.]|jgi:hypothetical protein|nr:hypothetical protein [Sphingomicrobium sp.]
MAKYDALAEHVRQQTLREFELPFYKIEAIIGAKLPDSALRPQYWANTVDGGGPVRRVLRDTPYDTFLISGSRRVRFERRF